MKKLVFMAVAIFLSVLSVQAQDKLDISNPAVFKPSSRVLTSADGRYYLEYQIDGNLVLYKKGFANAQNPVAIWSNGAFGKAPDVLKFQNDGNLVCYGFNPKVIWASNTFQKGAKYIYLQNDGNLVIYSAANKAIWSTDTYERNKGCK